MPEPSDMAGHNVPALSHETYAKQAVSSLRAGDKQVIKGSHNVIEALLIAHQNGVLPDVDIAELHTKRGREFNLNPIMHHIFGTRAPGPDGYLVVGGIKELARSGEALAPARRVKAQENDRLDKALRQQIIRNLAVVALLAEHGGAYHEVERPQGAAAIDDKAGFLQVRARAWHDNPARGDDWVLLDGTKAEDGPRTLTALQATARRHFGKAGPGRPRGSRTGANTMPAAVDYIHKVVVGGEVGTAEREQLASLLPDLLRVLCAEDGRLDLERVQAFWKERAA